MFLLLHVTVSLSIPLFCFTLPFTLHMKIYLDNKTFQRYIISFCVFVVPVVLTVSSSFYRIFYFILLLHVSAQLLCTVAPLCYE